MWIVPVVVERVVVPGVPPSAVPTVGTPGPIIGPIPVVIIGIVVPAPVEPDAKTPGRVVRIAAIVRDMRCRPGGGDVRIPYVVLEQVVVEERAAGHLGCQIGQIGFGILRHPPQVGHAVIPVIAAGELVEPEWVARKGRVHRTGTARAVHPEGFPVSATADLEPVTPTHEVVIQRVDGEKHAHPAIGLSV
jgi:hypothetical protein